MTPEECELVARLCASRAGLRVDPERVYLMESRLGPVARREGFTSIPDLLAELAQRREERLVWVVVEAMAHADTCFFRDREPFAVFADEVLPDLARARAGRPVRIWSAACASGEEIYSLAMACDRAGVPVELYASDLSSRALEKAQSGLYTQFEVQRGLPIGELVRNFSKTDEMWVVQPRIRQMIRWRRANLIGDLAAIGQFDVVFCRYVLETAVDAARTRILGNLAAALAPDGRLFLGLGEDASAAPGALTPAGRPGLFARDPAFRAAA